MDLSAPLWNELTSQVGVAGLVVAVVHPPLSVVALPDAHIALLGQVLLAPAQYRSLKRVGAELWCAVFTLCGNQFMTLWVTDLWVYDWLEGKITGKQPE